MKPKTTVYIAKSLDGFIARLDGSIDWLGEPEEGEDYGWAEFIATIDTIVMGRVTFEQVLTFGTWPYEGTPVVVLSTTLRSAPEGLQGKVELSSLEPRELVRALNERGFGRIYVDGGKTIQSFLRDDLIDELIITTLPVLIGQGIPLFGPIDSDMAWEHRSSQVFERGLVKCSYRRCR